jgi:hypothetical protein
MTTAHRARGASLGRPDAVLLLTFPGLTGAGCAPLSQPDHWQQPDIPAAPGAPAPRPGQLCFGDLGCEPVTGRPPSQSVGTGPFYS